MASVAAKGCSCRCPPGASTSAVPYVAAWTMHRWTVPAIPTAAHVPAPVSSNAAAALSPFMGRAPSRHQVKAVSTADLTDPFIPAQLHQPPTVAVPGAADPQLTGISRQQGPRNLPHHRPRTGTQPTDPLDTKPRDPLDLLDPLALHEHLTTSTYAASSSPSSAAASASPHNSAPPVSSTGAGAGGEVSMAARPSRRAAQTAGSDEVASSNSTEVAAPGATACPAPRTLWTVPATEPPPSATQEQQQQQQQPAEVEVEARPRQRPPLPRKRAVPVFSDNDPHVAAAYGSLPVEVTGRAAPPPLLSYNELAGTWKVAPLLLRNTAGAFRLGQPTPVQSHVIPAVLSGRDVLAVSCTGSGKTLAYLLPLLAQLMSRNRTEASRNIAAPDAIVLVPNRELAEQVYSDIQLLIRGAHLKAMVFRGGMSVAEQAIALRGKFRRRAGGADIIVSTPGRLLQLVEQRECLSLSRVGHLVVDEADLMFDLRLWPDLRRLLSHPGLPTARQTVVVSAAMPDGELKKVLRDAVTVVVGDGSGASGVVRQSVEIMRTADKLDRLTELLAPGPSGRLAGGDGGGSGANGPAVVFARTVQRAEMVAGHLAAKGISVGLLHRDLTQEQRDEAMQCFRFGVASVLVATELASRGLNFPDVAHVVNFDLPFTANVYIHQVGRTGRGGRPGRATTFMTTADRDAAPWLREVLQNSGSRVPDWLQRMAGAAEVRRARAAAQQEEAGDDPAAGFSGPAGRERGAQDTGPKGTAAKDTATEAKAQEGSLPKTKAHQVAAQKAEAPMVRRVQAEATNVEEEGRAAGTANKPTVAKGFGAQQGPGRAGAKHAAAAVARKRTPPQRAVDIFGTAAGSGSRVQFGAYLRQPPRVAAASSGPEAGALEYAPGESGLAEPSYQQPRAVVVDRKHQTEHWMAVFERAIMTPVPPAGKLAGGAVAAAAAAPSAAASATRSGRKRGPRRKPEAADGATTGSVEGGNGDGSSREWAPARPAGGLVFEDGSVRLEAGQLGGLTAGAGLRDRL